MGSDGAEEFVEGWLVAQVLGEGAYGEVRLLVHGETGACVALKSVRENEGGGAAREAALHAALRHPHVLRCLGARHHPPHHYMFLEFARGGDLFERIEPEAGCGVRAARRYLTQLAAGLAYLHARGVAHRDIKPENLLLDERDTLKISDFGLATVFRAGGRERLLARACGTRPYAAPEALAASPAAPYRAPPADVWAVGVVLVAMLAGELPWECAESGCARYTAWTNGADGAGGTWWPRVEACGAGALIRALLGPAAERPSTGDLPSHAWLRDTHTDRVPDPEPQPAIDLHGSAVGVGVRACSSQPAVWGAGAGATGAGDLSPAAMDALISCSQPALPDDVLASQPLSQLTQSGDVLALVARRLTRVYVRATDERAALSTLGDVLRTRNVPHALLHANLMSIEWGEVRMRAWAARAGAGRVVVELRRWRGCGLAFKRRVRDLRAALHDHAPPAVQHMDVG